MTSVSSIIAVNAIITIADDFILPIMERPERAKGKIGLIGGKVESGESFIDALLREIQEELGIKITENMIQKLCILHDFPETTVKHIYFIELDPSYKMDFKYDVNEIQNIILVNKYKISQNTELYRNDWVLKLLNDFVKGMLVNRNYTI